MGFRQGHGLSPYILIGFLGLNVVLVRVNKGLKGSVTQRRLLVFFVRVLLRASESLSSSMAASNLPFA